MLSKRPLLLILLFGALQQLKGQKLFTEKIHYVAPANPNNETSFDSIKGSPLLLKTWVRGVVVTMNDSVIDDRDLRMNFNKLQGQLIVTRDEKNYLHTEKRDIKGFVLYTDSGKLIFTKVPEINAKDYFQLLGMGNTCTLYKKVSTTVKGPGYYTNGSPEAAVRDARYEDYNTYYLMDVDDRNRFPGKFYPIKRSVQSVFGFDNDKLQQYFTQHGDAAINDAFIIGLAAYFNSQSQTGH